MGFTLIAKNYRVLRDVRIALDGICVFVGPNGAGKTTLLNVPALLRLAYEMDSFGSAVAHFGGAWYLRNLDAKDTDVVELGVQRSVPIDPEQGVWDEESWLVHLEPTMAQRGGVPDRRSHWNY